MTIDNGRPNMMHQGLLEPLNDLEQSAQFPAQARYVGDGVEPQHVGPRGTQHETFWTVRRRYGAVAIEVVCVRGLLDDRNRVWKCLASRRGSTGQHTWSDVRGRPGVERNVHKSTVLAAISRAGKACTVGELTEASGLPRATVAGVLAGSQRAKVPYVTRSASRETTPLGSAHTWSLTKRGRAWLVWAVQVGLLSTRKKGA